MSTNNLPSPLRPLFRFRCYQFGIISALNPFDYKYSIVSNISFLRLNKFFRYRGYSSFLRSSAQQEIIYVWSARGLISYSSCFFQQTSDNTIQTESVCSSCSCFIPAAKSNRPMVASSINHFVVVILCRSRYSSPFQPLVSCSLAA